MTYNFNWNVGIVERWNDGECSPLEGHALSWPDATKRVPPDCWPFSLSIFHDSNIPLFLFSYHFVNPRPSGLLVVFRKKRNSIEYITTRSSQRGDRTIRVVKTEDQNSLLPMMEGERIHVFNVHTRLTHNIQ